MKFRLGSDTAEQMKRRNIGQLRRTHLLTNYGPGALVDLPEYSVIMGACDYWERPVPIHEPRLEKLLKVKELKGPAPSEDLGSDSGVVRAFRFPYWCYCPHCHRLGPYWTLAADKKKLRCARCNTPLIPSRFVVACEHGHMEDFPYDLWVHNGRSCPVERDRSKPSLEITFSATTGNLSGITIHCKACGAERTMANCTANGALGGLRCRGHRPWIGDNREANDPAGCSLPLRALNRGATNGYFPMTTAALTIPSHESQLVTEEWNVITSLMKSDLTGAALQTALAAVLGSDLARSGLTVDDVITEVKQRQEKKTAITSRDIYEQEYQALTAPNTSVKNFKTIHVETPSQLQGLVKQVVLVPRLREVMALRGFRRISPASDDEEDLDDAQDEEGYKLTPPYAVDEGWLPAMELLGEGIFIELDSQAVDAWQEQVGNRYASMRDRLSESYISCRNFSPAFVLLHTLAHALIRQLTIDCGYSGSALKERIYSTWPKSEQHMYGILIYTSSTDSDGSMGGLVRQGIPERLIHTFEGALTSASWCSSDPVCSESTAQGYDSLNYAACYACTLLPETSCSMRNCLLDRVSLVGTTDRPELGFFTRFMNEMEG